ncbi:hydroxyisourate hydrolase [Anatilimnocola sp. NA78]|uniref:hydroxyisourate hydrolase n=1 Tax=Anatilimnocola sp. NA78 TaxID=3415683 RepID=UPI003CE5B0F8
MPDNSPITTHILDASRGCPAAGVHVQLEKLVDGEWQPCGASQTNSDGRVVDLLLPSAFTSGSYRLTFATGEYYQQLGTVTFYPQVVIEFIVTDVSQHYHVPLLLSPFGYSTYRGS